MLTKQDIINAHRALGFKVLDADIVYDCIEIAYQWLDAQVKTRNVRRKHYCLKHLIENWAGRYVSQDDVSVAAYIHPKIIGEYPYFNISTLRTDPSIARLNNILEAFTQHQRQWHSSSHYRRNENNN